MTSTQLMVGGLTQPTVSRGLIEIPASAEKGLLNHFSRLFPKPLYGSLSSLGIVDQDFIEKIIK